MNRSDDLLHHKLVGSVDALACCDFHGLLRDLLTTQLSVPQQRPCRTLRVQSSAPDADHVLDFQHVASAVQLDDDVLVDDDQSGLKVSVLLASTPLLRVADAALQRLLWVLRHHLLESLNQVECVGQRASETAVDPIRHLADLPGVCFDPRTPQRHLSISYDHSFSGPFEGEDGGVVPLFGGEAAQQPCNHLSYYYLPTQDHNYILLMIPQPINLSNQSEEQQLPQAKDEEILNGHGIHNSPQLILVSLLIIASVAVVFTTNQEIHQHDRYLRTYFNLNLLGKDDLGLYEEGLNIDECEMEFATLAEIKEHFTKMVNVSQSLQEDGLVVFGSNEEPVIRFEMQNRRNEFNYTAFHTVQEAFTYFNDFQTNALKDWLLESYVFKLTVNFGDNKFVKNYTLTGEYKLYSLLMVKAKLDTDYELRESKSRKLNGLRLTQQVIASLLFVIYLYQTILLKHQSKSHRLFSSEIQYSLAIQTKYRNWYLFLQLMCIIILFSPKYAPICAFLQILPVFEFPEREKDNEMYNFNKNLRFSFPLIMSIFLQMFIFLNGFILYSMLMYPGDYFDEYLKGFFSYVYQLFQVGTFEIFTELESYGNFAYMLYAMLYFYVFQLGNALVPALFVILIEMKITGEVLKRHVTQLAHESVCPQCNEKNSKAIDSNNVNIVVSSPRISPLINRKKFNRVDEDQSEGLMLYIQEEDVASPKHQHQKFHQNVKFANYSKRILNIARKLNIQVFKYPQKAYLQDCLKKIQALSLPE